MGRARIREGQLWVFPPDIKMGSGPLEVLMRCEGFSMMNGNLRSLGVVERMVQLAVGTSARARFDVASGGGVLVFIELEATRASQGVYVKSVASNLAGPNGLRYGYYVELNALGSVWSETGETLAGSYGVNDASAGTLLSQREYGVVERTIDSSVWPLTLSQCEAVARNFVENNMNPAIIRTVKQSAWRAYPVRPGHVGRRIALPGGAMGIVESRRYDEAHTPQGSSSSSEISVRITQDLKFFEVAAESWPVSLPGAGGVDSTAFDSMAFDGGEIKG